MTKNGNGRRPKLSARDRAIALLASCTDLVVRDTSDRPSLEVLIRALQAFKDGTLAHVYARPTDSPDQATRHSLFSELFEDLAFLAPKLKKYLRARGIRYVGEVYYVHFDRRSAAAVRYGEEILGALQTYLGLPREIDPLLDGWEPPYWTANFRATLSAPVIEVLGDEPSRDHWNRWSDVGYTSTARWIHKAGHHYMGTWLQDLRTAPSGKQGNPSNAWGVGQLEDLQGKLYYAQNLWAAALIPPDWQAPEGVPEVWTRLLEDEILPAIAAEEERRREEEAERQARRQKRLAQEAEAAVRCGDELVATHFDTLRKRVDELELSVRAANCLQNEGVEYIWQLCQKTESELLKTRNFGRKPLLEIKEILAEMELQLDMTFSQESLTLLRDRS